MAAFETLESVPIELLPLRIGTLAQDGAEAKVSSAKTEAEALRDLRSKLASTFNLSKIGPAPRAAELSRCAATIESTPFLRRLGADYREAIRLYRSLASDGKRAPRQEMVEGLYQLSNYCSRIAEFSDASSYKALLGEHFKGIDTKWADFQRLAAWYEEVRSTFPEHIAQAMFFRELFFNAKPDHIRKLRSNVSSIARARSSLEQTMSQAVYIGRTFPSPRTVADSGGSFDDFLAAVGATNRALSDALNEIGQIGLPETFVIRDLISLLEAATEARTEQSRIESDQASPRLLADHFDGVSTEVAPLRSTLRFVDAIVSNSLPPKALEWVLCDDYESHLSQFRAWLQAARDALYKLPALRQKLGDISNSTKWSKSGSEDAPALAALAKKALEQRGELMQWTSLLRLRDEGRQKGLHKLIALAEMRSFEPKDLSAAFAFVFYHSLARSVFSVHDELSQITGLTLDQLREQFAKADKEVIRLYRNRIAAQVDARPVYRGNKTGPVSTWTELALLTNEASKQKRHIPIRRLLERAGNTVLGLKPCFMMGPLSVAQYLAPGALKFDLIVMDEASQLRPEDAIGAIARGGQMVIVGDPKQLPPTTFFQRTQLDDSEDEENAAAVEEGESILDVASTLYQPVRRLRWHYRSRHHSLIAFSNKEFYNRDLVVFPSAFREHPSLGVKYVPIDGGVFDERRNQREASVVVDAVLNHMKTCPDESLGVVTLNFEQRELVEELLDSKIQNDPFALSYQERMKGPNEFFVKNLENVQGDERDVIFVSVTYGPDAHGNQYQRFGPITGENGHRRLNVLFTRAKKRIVIFSSLDPEKIQVTGSSAWGIRALKQYLAFARTGVLENSANPSEQAPNDFESSVGSVLKEKGFEVIPQIGVAGFFIDLGVVHPEKRGAFLFGIECDGASYHSGRSVRDRDRLRQEILESHGWKIYRIWSTDWFRSREKEMQRLLKHAADLLAVSSRS